MKILIVNGYSTTSSGVEAFSEFQWAIKKVQLFVCFPQSQVCLRGSTFKEN